MSAAQYMDCAFLQDGSFLCDGGDFFRYGQVF